MTSVDLIVLGVMFLSGMIAFMRGFVREVLSIGAWVGAAVVSLTCLPLLAPLIEPYVSPEWTEPGRLRRLVPGLAHLLSLIAKSIAHAVAVLIDRRHRPLVGPGLRPRARRGPGDRRLYRRVHGDPAGTLAAAVLESRSLPYIYTGAAWVARQIPLEYQPVVPPPPPPPPSTRQTARNDIEGFSGGPGDRLPPRLSQGNPPHG